VAGHWTEAYYGELYLESVEDLLSPRLTAFEAELIGRLLGLGPGQRVLDLACGHGRHAWPLAERVASLVGLERSAAYLARAAASPSSGPGPAPSFVRGDLRALPLRAGAFDAAFSWYASLFMFDEAGNQAVLREVARPLRRGGRLLVHHANPLALARAPRAEASRTLPGGGRVEEVSEFDPGTGVDRCARRLVRPDGSLLEGTAQLRYYSPTEWGPLARRAGLLLRDVTSTTPTAGGLPGPEAPDLIALLEKP
jgi:SAM-dependent methyltransferase